MIDDHAERVDRLQRALASAWLERPELLNRPGASLACKLDPHYYLALHPGFVDFLAKAAGMFQKNVREALLRTGNLLFHSVPGAGAGAGADPEAEPGHPGALSVQLQVLWEEHGKLRQARLESCFVHNSFIDRALLLYGRQSQELSVSSLAIASSEAPKVQAFLKGRTQLEEMAFR